MKKDSLSTTIFEQSGNASSLFEVKNGVRPIKLRSISEEKFSEVLLQIREKLNEGLSSAVEKIITDALANYSHTSENQAKLTQFLAYAYETQGRYKESLEVIERYDDEEVLSEINLETQIGVITQLAISFNNANDYPKAVALLNYALEEATAGNLSQLSGEIYVAFSRVYRKLNECPISRDYAEKALNYYRENGDWRGMAESYQAVALSYHQEGNSEKSLEFFELAIKIIGSRSAPFLLGKIYSDMSGAYWFLRRPHDGIACLEKSIKFFEQTEHKVRRPPLIIISACIW
jgi:tetratricopeptide (TPR) repeat protein